MEQIEIAVIRQVHEILGVLIYPHRVLAISDLITPEAGRHQVWVTYAADLLSGEAVLNSSLTGDVGWILENRLPAPLPFAHHSQLYIRQASGPYHLPIASVRYCVVVIRGQKDCARGWFCRLARPNETTGIWQRWKHLERQQRGSVAVTLTASGQMAAIPPSVPKSCQSGIGPQYVIRKTRLAAVAHAALFR
jgi:hypothetical protein